MSRTVVGPLMRLVSIVPVDLDISSAAMGVIQAGILDLLRQEQVVEAGSSLVLVGERKGLKDASWGKDIANITERIKPHLISEFNQATGLWVKRLVGVKLGSLRCEVDDNGEVCAWIYEES